MLTLVAAFVIFLILVFAEFLSRRGVHSELTRKLVHMMVGTFVAFWPFFLSWRQIQYMSLAFLIVVFISLKLRVFDSVHGVKRRTMGEVLFALVIGILAFIVSNKYIFAAAMLHLSLADGFAAIFGLAWGEGSTYKIMKRTKSLVGSLAFFFTSFAILVWFAIFSHAGYSAVTLVWLPVIATIAENVSGEGTDNMVVPLLVALVLSSSL